MESLKLNNGIEIDFVTRGDKFLGLGEVRSGKTILRSGRRPMFAEIRNPSGIEVTDWKVKSSSLKADGAEIIFAGDRREGGIMEYMVHTVRNRVNTADWTADPTPASDSTLKLEIKPVKRKIGTSEFAGFSYRYTFTSKSIPVYRVNDRSTWEIGGSSKGNEVIMRNCFVPARAKVKDVSDHYSTEWFLPNATNPNIFQFLPLQTELQGFSFTSHDAGILITWVSVISHTRSLFEKQRGKDEIVHWHEHCNDLSHDFKGPPVEVLFSAGKRTEIEMFNVHEDVKELVHETLHNEVGMRRERVTTYGQIEEWTLPDMKYYTEKGLPKLIDAGVKTVYCANHFRNNMNTWGIGNMCNTVDYVVADSVGEANLKKFCDTVKAGGARVEMWGNTSIATTTWLFNWESDRDRVNNIKFLPPEGSIMQTLKDVPNAFVRNPSNAIEADHYTPMFCVLNLREPAVIDYWMKRWTYAAEKIGLGGIFLDSSFNLSSDKFHWVQNANLNTAAGATADQTQLLGFFRPANDPPAAILSQYKAHLELFMKMQKVGYVYCNEDLGVFGVHRHGPDLGKRLDTFPIWSDCYTGYEHAAMKTLGLDPDAIFFEGLAYRVMWSLHWDIGSDRLSWNYGGVRSDDDLPTKWQLSLLKAYNQVESNLKKRTLLADKKGVVWNGGDKVILFAFADFAHPLGGSTSVRDVLSNEKSTATSLSAKKNRIYEIG